MRKLVVVLATMLLLFLGWAPSQAAPAGSPLKGASLHVDYKTSAIVQFDPSPTGTGPLMPAVSVTGVVKNCPEGGYRLSGSLVQNRVTVPMAQIGLGGGEVDCHGSKLTPVSAPFAGPKLHPGHAKVHLSFAPLGCESKSCTLSVTKVVLIPGKRPHCTKHGSASRKLT